MGEDIVYKMVLRHMGSAWTANVFDGAEPGLHTDALEEMD